MNICFLGFNKVQLGKWMRSINIVDFFSMDEMLKKAQFAVVNQTFSIDFRCSWSKATKVRGTLT